MAVQRGGWEDLVAPIVTAAMGLPLAGAGALIGTMLGGPVAGAWAAAVGGSLVGVVVAGQEIWGGTRPGATIPVRWKMVGLALAPVGLNAVGAGIGYAVAGTASAVMAGTLLAAAIPFTLLWGTVLVNRWRDRNLPVPSAPVPAPAQP
jgi:hypothetical protein